MKRTWQDWWGLENERSGDNIGNLNHCGVVMVSEERGNMRYGDPEYQKQLDFINVIPSNKFDTEDLSKLTKGDMDGFNEKHLRDLREQIRGYDEQELRVVADEVTKRGWTFTYNALGNYFENLHQTLNDAKSVINDE